VQDTLNKARKRDREASAEALKKIYQAETQKEAEEALRSLRGGGHGLLQDRGALGNQGLRSFSLPASSEVCGYCLGISNFVTISLNLPSLE